MLAALAPATFGPDRELEDARESLAYWEARARTLPRHAIRRRREAREMTARWQARVAEAERLVYGRGLLGALLLLAASAGSRSRSAACGRAAARGARSGGRRGCVACLALPRRRWLVRLGRGRAVRRRCVGGARSARRRRRCPRAGPTPAA